MTESFTSGHHFKHIRVACTQLVRGGSCYKEVKAAQVFKPALETYIYPLCLLGATYCRTARAQLPDIGGKNDQSIINFVS